ncbi:MAG: hypothetical protein GY953_30745, partial [bacterium]|nr:hypothetical protein [bacterium]
MKIFRWEKEEAIPNSAKLWLLVVGLPFVLLGVYQAYSRENIDQARALDRELRRNRTSLVRGARIFVGDGTVIDSGGILIRKGKVAAVYDGATPEPDSVNADVVEAAGKTVLPGLIDVHVHLGSPGGVVVNEADFDFAESMDRALAAYLYSGVVAVRSAGDALEPVLDARRRVAEGQRLGAELNVCGPLFTVEGGHGTEYFDQIPAGMRALVKEQF